MRRTVLFLMLGLGLGLGGLASFAPKENVSAAPPESVKQAEAERIKVINKVRPAVVAVYSRGGGGGGSGVLIDKEGYALTNFHVVAPAGPIMSCGLSDGILYDAVVVGIDQVGDVALIKLIPKEKDKPFPFVELADSDKVKLGEWSLAMGNPFLLATDFTPTVTFGLVSGVNRYQPPESKGFLEYTDCIQIDTSINPGNSGGPLFNMKGELIGINGRGSFDKRVRINSGVGYAISINQIKNFMGHLRVGLNADHATLGADIRSSGDDGDLARMNIGTILEDSDIARRGLEEGDLLVSFAGRQLSSVNQYKNVLGIYPKEWRLPLVYQKGNDRKETLVRLMSHQAGVIQKKDGNQPPPPPNPKQPIQPKGPPPSGEVAKFYKAKAGFANYYFNEQAQERIHQNLKKQGYLAGVTGKWHLEGQYDIDGVLGSILINIHEVEDKALSQKSVVFFKTNLETTFEPLKANQELKEIVQPNGTGGVYNAFFHWRHFITKWKTGYRDEDFMHAGIEPIYIAPLDPKQKKSFKDQRIMAEVIRTSYAGTLCKWYFYNSELNPGYANPNKYPEGALIFGEVFASTDLDPCELYFHDFKQAEGRTFPHLVEVRNDMKRYALYSFTKKVAFDEKGK